MIKLGKPIARRMIPARSCPSPATKAPARTNATLPTKNGLSRLPRFSILIGFAPGATPSEVPGAVGCDVREGPAFGTVGGGLAPPSETCPV
jgi:hypothetical protein